MKLTDIEHGPISPVWAEKGYQLPKFDREAVKAKTAAEPTWVHFGAGNIFRAFPAAILQQVLDSGKYDRGVIVAESFDYEIIDKAYRPYDNLSLLVCLQSTGTIEKKVIASVTESLKADPQFTDDWARLVEIFQKPSLQMVSFTITEKGYGFNPADLERGMGAQFAMGKVTALLYERYKAGALPLTLQSMDNCSHNGDKVKAGVFAYAEKWAEMGIVPAGFVDYVKDESKPAPRRQGPEDAGRGRLRGQLHHRHRPPHLHRPLRQRRGDRVPGHRGQVHQRPAPAGAGRRHVRAASCTPTARRWTRSRR